MYPTCQSTSYALTLRYVSGLDSFFTYFSEYQGASLSLFGESYGGHYVPCVGDYISK
ncbi:peptidase S10, serine carboxypeptidase, partial [Kipferlia bialata]|eukprot:g16092.t1